MNVFNRIVVVLLFLGLIALAVSAVARPLQLYPGSDDATVERRRTDQIVAAIDQIQAAAVDADVWKVEGSASVDDCRRVAAQATAGGRDDVGVVVLGAGAPAATVEGWLAAGAAAGYRGFAVGRSIWAEPLLQLDAGGIDELAARAEIARRYLSFVESFRA